MALLFTKKRTKRLARWPHSLGYCDVVSGAHHACRRLVSCENTLSHVAAFIADINSTGLWVVDEITTLVVILWRGLPRSRLHIVTAGTHLSVTCVLSRFNSPSSSSILYNSSQSTGIRTFPVRFSVNHSFAIMRGLSKIEGWFRTWMNVCRCDSAGYYQAATSLPWLLLN